MSLNCCTHLRRKSVILQDSRMSCMGLKIDFSQSITREKFVVPKICLCKCHSCYPSMQVARGGGRGGLNPPSSSQVQNLRLKLVLYEGIIALRTLKFSCAYQKMHFLGRLQRKNVDFWSILAKMAKIALTYDGYSSIFLIMRSFKTFKVELFQLDPTPGFGLATPMNVALFCIQKRIFAQPITKFVIYCYKQILPQYLIFN